MCDVCRCGDLEYHGGRRPRDVNPGGSRLNPEGSQLNPEGSRLLTEQGDGAPGNGFWLRQERKEG